LLMNYVLKININTTTTTTTTGMRVDLTAVSLPNEASGQVRGGSIRERKPRVSVMNTNCVIWIV